MMGRFGEDGYSAPYEPLVDDCGDEVDWDQTVWQAPGSSEWLSETNAMEEVKANVLDAQILEALGFVSMRACDVLGRED